MWEHMYLRHGAPREVNPETDFKFQKISSHRDPLSRQVEEAIRINQVMDRKTITSRSGPISKVNSLNRKEEHFAPRKRRNYQ